MPRITSLASARIAEWLELKSLLGHSDLAPEFEKSRAIGRDEVRHSAALPHVTVKPEATVHRVNHPVKPSSKLSIRRWIGPDY